MQASNKRISILATVLGTLLLSAVGRSQATASGDTIGIFDLKAIHSVPLDPEVLSKTKQGDIVIEQVRYTSLPGVRMLMTLTYKEGAKGAPGYEFVENFPVKPLVAEAGVGFCGIVISPPTGNKDPKKLESVGGPVYSTPFNFNAQFLPDKESSYIYQYTVALVRGLDYLATRPEVNVSNTVVTSYSWASTMVGLLHAIDDRPAATILFHAPGYFVDEQGLTGGKPLLLSQASGPSIPLTRKLYNMYCPAAYAAFGTKPIYIGTALDDSYTRLDAVTEMYAHLKSPKAFAFSPNRHHATTARNELNSYQWWLSSWIFAGPKPTTVGEGVVKTTDGRVTYTCPVDSKVPLTHAELLVSYGKPGDWLARSWHRLPMTQQGETLSIEIPVFDPSVPCCVIAQIESEKFGVVANGPQWIDPQVLGLSKPNAGYPNELFNPTAKDDLYLRVGTVEWSSDGPSGKGSAIISPGPEGTITFQNIDGVLWKGKKTLSIWLKGEGKPGPIRAYLTYDSNYYLEVERKNYTAIELIAAGTPFAAEWREYSIPLDKVTHLDQVTSLFFDSQKRKLQIGPIILK